MYFSYSSISKFQTKDLVFITFFNILLNKSNLNKEMYTATYNDCSFTEKQAYLIKSFS